MDYDVNTMVVTPEKRLGLVGLLKVLQDIAWIHGAHLGHGFEAMKERGQLWALARQGLRAHRWPAWGDTMTVSTWVRPVTGMFVMRDYAVTSAGCAVAEATAAWIVLDAVRRRPLRFHAADIGAREDGVLDIEPERLGAFEAGAPLSAFDVRWSDLDANGHVNNTRYAEWLIDALPEERRTGQVVTGYEANFLAETLVGDRVGVEWTGPGGKSSPLALQGRRQGDGKVVFAARLGLEPV
jgi:acyl-ACP thioesterase